MNAYSAGFERRILNNLSTRLTLLCQSFPVPQYSPCQYVPRRKKTTPVCPGLHHTSFRISDAFSHSVIGKQDRYVVHTFPKLPSGGGCSCESFLFNIQLRISGGTVSSLMSWVVRSARPVLANAPSTRSHNVQRFLHSGG